MKVNLHTHTTRCYHAVGEDEEYVQAAIDAGFEKLGFSDHTPFPYTDGFHNPDKMEIHRLEDYISSVERLREKYWDRLPIYMGLECEVIPEFFGFLGECRQQMDFLILGNHGDKRIETFFGRISELPDLRHYTDMAVKGMETGLFLYLCHPDLMFNYVKKFCGTCEALSRELCRASKALNVPLEYNLSGTRHVAPEGCLGYPTDRFWEIVAEEGAEAVIGVDAHNPEHLRIADLDAAKDKLTQMGIRVIEDPTVLLCK